MVSEIPFNSEYIFVQKLLHVLTDLPAKLQSKRYKVKKTAVIVAPNQNFFIDYSPMSYPIIQYDDKKDLNTHTVEENQSEECEIWTTVFEPPVQVPHQPTRPPDTTTLTGSQFMQHFPSSPPTRKISLSSEETPSLAWDEQDSFQAFSTTMFPSPPEALHSNQPTPPEPDLSLKGRRQLLPAFFPESSQE